MGYKKLISPEFRVTVGDYEVTDGIEVECSQAKSLTWTGAGWNYHHSFRES